jgi:hypothetical protein
VALKFGNSGGDNSSGLAAANRLLAADGLAAANGLLAADELDVCLCAAADEADLCLCSDELVAAAAAAPPSVPDILSSTYHNRNKSISIML